MVTMGLSGSSAGVAGLGDDLFVSQIISQIPEYELVFFITCHK